MQDIQNQMSIVERTLSDLSIGLVKALNLESLVTEKVEKKLETVLALLKKQDDAFACYKNEVTGHLYKLNTNKVSTIAHQNHQETIKNHCPIFSEKCCIGNGRVEAEYISAIWKMG